MEPFPYEEIASETPSRIVYFILDGLGGLPVADKGGSEMDVAKIPNLDDLARRSACGLLDPVGPGISPGSGPGHLALFGYDPVRIRVGRGVLAALGIDFPVTERDLAARLNFCTLDSDGKITDRRAGRISSEENARLCGKLREGVKPPEGMEIFFETVSEHRALLAIRGDGLSKEIGDSDPQATGVAPLEPRPLHAEAERTARIVSEVLRGVREVLGDEPRANGVLARGFDKIQKIPTMAERYRLKASAVAKYPMYRGLARLVGMEIAPVYGDLEEGLRILRERIAEDTFVFFHIKDPDKAGEDGDFDAKVAALERIDEIVPDVVATGPDVLVVTGDHSTPSALARHSWHPVPVLLHAEACRWGGVSRFTETECARGSLSRLPMTALMPEALGHAGKLLKFGA
jgi:2,3-bisphosphoglycerate-independent phosphoglycerate mutase